MLVVVITGDTSDVFDYVSDEAKVTSAVLLRNSPYEVVVHPLRDTLLLICGNERLALPLEPGAAKNLHRESKASYTREDSDALAELERLYRGDDLPRLKEFIRRISQSPKKEP